MPFNTRKLSNALGAEITGFKINDDVGQETIDALRNAFLKYQVLLFRDQDISFETHIAFSRKFGDLDNHESVPEYRFEAYPQLIRVTNEGKEPTKVFGRQWHSDHSMTLVPSMASQLHAREIPDVGGDTMFTNMYLAYDHLSEGMRRLLDGLEAVHTVQSARHLSQVDGDELKAKMKRNPPVAHPVVIVHPETGRKALYVSEMMTSQLVGMTREESQSILQYLFELSTLPEFVYRHVWRKHDLLMWDNRCTMHIALSDYDHTQLRDLYRTTIKGSRAGRYVEA